MNDRTPEPTPTPAVRRDKREPPPPRLFVKQRRVRCPECRSKDIQTQRSVDNGDGTRTKLSKCRACSINFDVLLY